MTDEAEGYHNSWISAFSRPGKNSSAAGAWTRVGNVRSTNTSKVKNSKQRSTPPSKSDKMRQAKRNSSVPNGSS